MRSRSQEAKIGRRLQPESGNIWVARRHPQYRRRNQITVSDMHYVTNSNAQSGQNG
ncbi:hypothetical protein ACLOJK_024138 [Asimina triloba]